MIRAYNLRASPEHVRAIIREEFDKHLHIRERKVIDLLVYKGENELMETKEMWKTYSHVAEFFERPLSVKATHVGHNIVVPAEQIERKKKERILVETVIKSYYPEYDVSTITDENVEEWVFMASWYLKMFDENTGPQEYILPNKDDYQL